MSPMYMFACLVGFFVLALLVAGMVELRSEVMEFSETCKSAGGVPIVVNGGKYHCIKGEAFVKMESK